MEQKRTVRIIFGIVVVVVIYILQQVFFKTPSFDKVMMETASEINKNCPIMVDQETRLDNVIALPNNVYQYNYTLINRIKDSLNVEDIQNYFEPKILNNVKTDPALEIFRKNKKTMAFHYRDKNGEFILNISITPEKYNQ